MIENNQKLQNIINKEISLKKICEILEWRYNSKGNSRASIIKKLKSLCDYNVIGKGRGTKIIIREVFKEAKPIKDGRVKDCEFIKELETLILEAINKENFCGHISSKNLFDLFDILPNNKNKKIEENVSPSILGLFFMTLKSQKDFLISKGLSSLKRKNIVHSKKGIILCFDDTIRLATKREVLEFKEIEEKVMGELKISKKQKSFGDKQKLYILISNKIKDRYLDDDKLLECCYKGYLIDRSDIPENNDTTKEKEIIKKYLIKKFKELGKSLYKRSVEKESEVYFGKPLFVLPTSQEDFLKIWDYLIEEYIGKEVD